MARRTAFLPRTVERLGAGVRLRAVPGAGVGAGLRASCTAADRRRRRQPLRADPHQLHPAGRWTARRSGRLAGVVVVAHRPPRRSSSAALVADLECGADRCLAAARDRAAPTRARATCASCTTSSATRATRSSGRQPPSRRWSAASTSSAHGSSMPSKDPRSTPNYIGFVLFVALVGVSARWAWRRRLRVELSLYAVLARGDRAGVPVDDTDLRQLLRVRHPMDVATGGDVGCSQLVVVLAHMARASAATESARHDDRDHRCRGVHRSSSPVVGVVRASAAEVPYRTGQCADRRPVGPTRALPRPEQALSDQRVRPGDAGRARLRAGAPTGT